MTIVRIASSTAEFPSGPARAGVGTLQLRRDRTRLRSVTVQGRHVGVIADVLLDASFLRVLGFDVTLADGDSCFVPLVAVSSLGPTGIEVESALHLVRDVRFYRIAGEPASSVLGRSVGCRHAVRGAVADVTVDLASGELLAFELGDGTAVERAVVVPVGEAFRVACDCA